MNIRMLGAQHLPFTPQKYQEFQDFKRPKKIFEILATQKISQFCTLTLKKTLKCIEMTLKLAQFCDDTQKISTKSSFPKKYSFVWKPQKILKFRILNPPKNSQSLCMCENIRVTPPGSTQSVMVMKFSDGHLQTL